MSNPNKKLKTDLGSIACCYVDDQKRNKRKMAKQPAKNLLDLNDDCLFAIFERADVMDLANVAQSCKYLEPIAFNIFQRKHKSLTLIFSDIVTVEQAARAKLLFQIFGSNIVELDIQFEPRYFNGDEDYWTADVLHAIVTHCSLLKSLKLASFHIPDDEFWFIRIRKLFARLEKLQLKHCFIESWYWSGDCDTTENGNAINCFDNCTSLRELKLIDSYDFYYAIYRNFFPQHFIIDEPETCSFKSEDGFISRHPHLKTFSLSSEEDHLPIAVANLRNLEIFGFEISIRYPTSIESVAKFRHLKELTCFFVGHEENMSRLLNTLPKLANTLEVLDLRYGCGNRTDFIAAVNSLKKLKVVRLTDINIKDTPDYDLKDLLRATVIFE